MQAFRDADRAIISNARCLTEGVDVPAVDVVAFLSPRKSKVDIVQLSQVPVLTMADRAGATPRLGHHPSTGWIMGSCINNGTGTFCGGSPRL
jgi:hypothetical protein